MTQAMSAQVLPHVGAAARFWSCSDVSPQWVRPVASSQVLWEN